MSILKDLFVKTDNYKFDSVEFIMGNCGSDKTLYAVKQLMKYKKKGYPIYSNVFVRGARKISLDDLMKYDLEENAVVLIDEGAVYGLASRGSAYKTSNKSNIIEFFNMQRHYKVRKVIVISPSFQDVIPIVRARVKGVTIIRKSLLFNLLLLPINLILLLLHFQPWVFSSATFVNKKIIVPKSKGEAVEPIESFVSLPLFRKFTFNNLYYKYFNSFCRKELPSHDWDLYR